MSPVSRARDNTERTLERTESGARALRVRLRGCACTACALCIFMTPVRSAARSRALRAATSAGVRGKPQLRTTGSRLFLLSAVCLLGFFFVLSFPHVKGGARLRVYGLKHHQSHPCHDGVNVPVPIPAPPALGALLTVQYHAGQVSSQLRDTFCPLCWVCPQCRVASISAFRKPGSTQVLHK